MCDLALHVLEEATSILPNHPLVFACPLLLVFDMANIFLDLDSAYGHIDNEQTATWLEHQANNNLPPPSNQDVTFSSAPFSEPATTL